MRRRGYCCYEEYLENMAVLRRSGYFCDEKKMPLHHRIKPVYSRKFLIGFLY
jgi:predicted transcriptional regulator of viral defense system